MFRRFSVMEQTPIFLLHCWNCKTATWEQFWFLRIWGSYSSILWDLMPCSLLKVNQRFGGIFRLHVQGWWVSRARNQHEAGVLILQAYHSKQQNACAHTTCLVTQIKDARNLKCYYVLSLGCSQTVHYLQRKGGHEYVQNSMMVQDLVRVTVDHTCNG